MQIRNYGVKWNPCWIPGAAGGSGPSGAIQRCLDGGNSLFRNAALPWRSFAADNAGDFATGREYLKKAVAPGDRVSERERQQIASFYDETAGELESGD